MSEDATLHSRRGLLTGIAAAGVGAAAGVAMGGEPALATTTGTPVVLGTMNPSSATTTVKTDSGDGLKGVASKHKGVGVVGEHTGGTKTNPHRGTGVLGTTPNGIGVLGRAALGTGVQGETRQTGWAGVAGLDHSTGGGHGVGGWSTSGNGVEGASTNGDGVDGFSTNATGVSGSSTNGTGTQGWTTADGQSGTAGIDNSTTGGHGAYGRSTAGVGVYGTSTNGVGVYGITTNATGVYGETAADGRSGTAGIDTSTGGGHGSYGRSTNGTGAYGETYGDGQCGVEGVDLSSGGGAGLKGSSTNGVALAVDGRAKFTSSGVFTVPEGLASLSVAGPYPFATANSIILATCQTDVGGVWVKSAKAGANIITIVLNTVAPQSIDVAFLVIG